MPKYFKGKLIKKLMTLFNKYFSLDLDLLKVDQIIKLKK
jgi:hypothetical protein